MVKSNSELINVYTDLIRNYDKTDIYKNMSPKEYGISLQGKRKKKKRR